MGGNSRFPRFKKLGNQRAFSSNNLLKKDEEEKPPQMHKSASVILTNGEDSPDKKQRIRQEAVKELMSTEQDYINDLGLVEEIFIKPLTARNIIEKQDILCIFSNIEMLRGVNQEILKMFNQDPSGEHVGEAFLSIMHFFKAYTSYCANHQASLLTIKKYQTKNSSFTAFLDECMADPRCRRLPLPSYLIKPIQRLCKYPLILKTIYRNTEESHPDYANLGEALVQMEKIVDYINEAKRATENSQKIMEIQSNIDGGENLALVQPTRKLVLEDTLEVMSPKTKTTTQRYCLLFNDLFVSLKKKKRNGAYSDPLLLPLESVKFIEISDTEDVQNSFELTVPEETKSATLVFPNPESKLRWLKEIKKIIRFYQKQRIERGL